MEERIRRLEQQAERAAKALDELADEPEMARIALIGVFCAAAVCWFAIAWGDPRVLVLLPVVAAGTVWVARRKRQDAAHDDDVELEPAPAEVDQWLARLPTPPQPFAAATPPSPTVEPQPLPLPEPALHATADDHVESAVYEVRELQAGAYVLLETRESFDAAVDAAFELIEERDPPALEIIAATGTERDVVWSYTREAAQGERPKGSLDLFGFDASRWTQAKL